MMEAVTDKDRIFELYLNSIEWHYGVFGAEAASQYFYKKPASALTRQQAAKLTARVPARCFTQTTLRANGCTTKPISSYAAWVRQNYLKAIWINQKRPSEYFRRPLFLGFLPALVHQTLGAGSEEGVVGGHGFARGVGAWQRIGRYTRRASRQCSKACPKSLVVGTDTETGFKTVFEVLVQRP